MSKKYFKKVKKYNSSFTLIKIKLNRVKKVKKVK